ncbi:MAG: hypothetical protein CR997_11250 [Acidobacteria bacterium]|nr:MAG: hypothetical protein CR997_11250 [Acidobacteriota bacterium]
MKNTHWLIMLAVFLAGLIAILFWHLSQTQATAAADIIVLLLTTLNALLFLTLFFIITRSIMKLYSERKDKRKGFRIKTKLFFGILPLSLIPAGMMYFFSSQILSRTLQRLSIDSNIAKVIEEAYQLNEQVIHQFQTLFQNSAHLFVDPEAVDNPEAIQKLLEQFQLSGIEYYPDDAKEKAVYLNGLEPYRLSLIQQSKQKTEKIKNILYDDGLSVWRFPYRYEGGELVLVLVQESPFTERWAFLSDSYSYLNHAKRKRDRVSDTYKTTLLIITFAVVFGGIWMGTAFSRSLMRSLKILIHGTDQVARGNFDNTIELQTGDELEDLGVAFNSMILQLKENRQELQTKALDLESVNKQLSEQFDYTETLIKEVNAGIISCHMDGTIRTCNPAAEKMISFKPKHIKEFNQYENLTPLQVLWERYTRHGYNPLTEQVEWLRAHEQLNVAVTLIPIQSKGQLLGSIMVLENLTPLLNAQKLAAWREVARRVAHEIKNPLTPIQLSIQRIYRKSQQNADNLKDVIQSGYETISSEINLLSQLVNEFSNYAKLPAPAKERFELVNLLKSSFQSLSMVHRQVQLQLDLKVNSLDVTGDASQIRQVLNNLVDNAASASQQGDRITLSLDCSDSLAYLRIRDRGKGIPDDEKRKIFIPYYSKSPKGTGLGLAIVQRIIYDHGWQILVSDNHPKGTIFTIQIPI